MRKSHKKLVFLREKGGAGRFIFESIVDSTCAKISGPHICAARVL